MTHAVRALLFLATSIACLGAHAQKETQLKVPTVFAKARYDLQANTYSDEKNVYRADYWTFTKKNSLRAQLAASWTVFTNKAGVQLLDAPNGSARGGAFPFSHIFWVYGEDGEWLKVGDELATAVGWVHKRDLILWKTPLRDKDTGIEIKAFAVNTPRAGEAIRSGAAKDRFVLFDSPQGGQKLDDRPLYEVLFVFQYAPRVGDEPGRYLVGENSDLNKATKLTGWVSEDRLKIWPTNLCLEPNWDAAAVQERRERKVYAHLFETAAKQKKEERDAYFAGRGPAAGALFTEPRDPAYKNHDGDWKSRLPGFLFRYPIFRGESLVGDNCVFFTGAPAKLSAETSNVIEGAARSDIFRKVNEEVVQMKKTRENLNVVFVVEAATWARAGVADVAKALRKNDDGHLSMGAVVYGNDDANKASAAPSTYMNVMKPERAGTGLESWLQRLDWDPKGDRVESRPVRQALVKAISLARLGETNVIIHLCGAPDHSERDLNDERAGYMDGPAFRKAVTAGNSVHYLGYIIPNPANPDITNRAYDELQVTLQSLANGTKEKYGSIGMVQFKEGMTAARVVEMEPGRAFRMTPVATELRVRKFDPGTDLGILVTKDLFECKKEAEAYFEAMKSAVEDGSDVGKQADVASAEASASMMNILCEGVAKGSESLRQQCLVFAQANKVHYFIDATTRYKQEGAKYPLYKYVVFMSAADLDTRIKRVSSVVSALGDTPADRRKALQDHWEETAKDVLGKVDPKAALRDIIERMNGISQLNVVVPFKVEEVFGGLNVNSLDDPKVLTNERVVAMGDHYGRQLNSLRGILADPALRYETGKGQIYYWVPAEYLLN